MSKSVLTEIRDIIREQNKDKFSETLEKEAKRYIEEQPRLGMKWRHKQGKKDEEKEVSKRNERLGGGPGSKKEKKTIKEQDDAEEDAEDAIEEEYDPRDIDSAMLEGTDEIVEQLKEKIKSNIRDFAREHSEDEDDADDPSYIAEFLYDALDLNDLDTVHKAFVELYGKDWE